MEMYERISKLPIDIQDIIYKKHNKNMMNKVIQELESNSKVHEFIYYQLGFCSQDYEEEQFDEEFSFMLCKEDFDNNDEFLEAVNDHNEEVKVERHRRAIDRQNEYWHGDGAHDGLTKSEIINIINNAKFEEWKYIRDGLSMSDIRLMKK
mgnify:CR=1 FL=1